LNKEIIEIALINLITHFMLVNEQNREVVFVRSVACLKKLWAP